MDWRLHGVRYTPKLLTRPERTLQATEPYPDQVLELARANGDKVPRDVKTQFKNAVNSYVQGSKLGEAHKIQAALRSFLTAHEVALVLTRQERVHYRRSQVIGETIPTVDKIYCMVELVEDT